MSSSYMKVLEDFKQGRDNYIIISISDSKNRGLVHEWSRNNGFESKSEYVRDSKRISQVCCCHCGEWNKLREVKHGNDYMEDCELAYSFGFSNPEITPYSHPDDYYIECFSCEEKTYYDSDNDSDTIRWKTFPTATGRMIIMKTKEPGYKLKTRGWWRPRRENITV